MKTTYSLSNLNTVSLRLALFGFLSASLFDSHCIAGDIPSLNLPLLAPSTQPVVGAVTAPSGLGVSSGYDGSSNFSSFTDASTQPVDTDIVARVDGADVTIADIRTAILQLDPERKRALAHDPALFEQLVRSVSLKKVVLKEAIAKHWEEDPAIAGQLEKVKESIVADSYLLSITKTPDNYPSDADLHAAYEAGKDELLAPRQFHIAQIFVALPKNADQAEQDDVQKKLDAIHQKLNMASVSFTQVASENTTEKALAARGGDMGWIVESTLPPLIREQADSLHNGGTSEPIRLDDGWHIIKLVDTREKRQLSFEEVRQELVDQLRAKRALADRQAYLENLLKQNPVTIDDKVFAKAIGSLQKP